MAGLPFLDRADPSAKCLRDDSSVDWITYGELRQRASEWQERLECEKALVFLYAFNDVASVAALMGALSAGHAVALLDPNLPAATKSALHDLYSPEFIIDCGAARQIITSDRRGSTVHPELCLLLSTSGSTGSPKFVRLTLGNILSNAGAIAEVLNTQSTSVAAAHLPLHYSFGMSVLTSHLFAGAAIRLTESGFMDRSFWGEMKAAGITQLQGVPFHFQMMEKLGYGRIDLPDLMTLVQAGGHLDVDSRWKAHRFMEERGGSFCVMYGQTEASPRMTTLSHQDFPSAPASVGPALPGGSLEIEDSDEDGRGEVLYRGPNVMMGYAECREDLAKGDEFCGLLRTHDLGFLDEAGRLTLTGRASRSGKVYGLRVNLDEVEKLANSACACAVIQCGEGLCIFHESGGSGDLQQLLNARFTLPAAAYRFIAIDRIPRTERGKIDYRALQELA